MLVRTIHAKVNIFQSETRNMYSNKHGCHDIIIRCYVRCMNLKPVSHMEVMCPKCREMRENTISLHHDTSDHQHQLCKIFPTIYCEKCYHLDGLLFTENSLTHGLIKLWFQYIVFAKKHFSRYLYFIAY